MPKPSLHVIADETPLPANDGASWDLLSMLETFRQLGVEVQLHYFFQEKPPHTDLEKVCASAHAYPVHSIWTSLPWRFPHQVIMRRSGVLLRKLKADNDPVLFTGLRSCYYLSHPELESRRRAVRTTVLEWEYLYNVAGGLPSLFNRWFVSRESALMNIFQQTLSFADFVFAISEKDQQNRTAAPNVEIISAFLPYQRVESAPGRGEYCLFHGYLGDPANHAAAMYLVEQVWPGMDAPLYLAGSDPREELIAAVSAPGAEGIFLRHNPDPAQMDQLIREAQVIVLPAIQPVTFPYKLLISLFAGRHVVASPLLAHRSGLEFGCVMAHDAADFQAKVRRMFSIPFTQEERDRRALLLEPHFDNRKSAALILERLCS